MVIQEFLTRLQRPTKIACEVRQRPQGGAELSGIMRKPGPILPLLLDMIEHIVETVKALSEVFDLFAELQILLI